MNDTTVLLIYIDKLLLSITLAYFKMLRKLLYLVFINL